MANSIVEQLEQLEREMEERRRALLQPARTRLQEIERIREELDREEDELLELLGEKKQAAHAVFAFPKKTRRSSGKRMTAQHKKEVVAKFINNGHIKNNAEMTRELRAALMDEGLGAHDLRVLQNYMPSGWQARNNGQRGLLAKTTFHQG